jgi:hypothetical protein
MQTKVNGISLGYRIEGPAGGPVIMMSHGLALDFTLWSPQMSALVQQMQVVGYDLRGHGASEKTVTTLDVREQAEDAAGLLKKLGISRVHFIGLSMGGMMDRFSRSGIPVGEPCAGGYGQRGAAGEQTGLGTRDAGWLANGERFSK